MITSMTSYHNRVVRNLGRSNYTGFSTEELLDAANVNAELRLSVMDDRELLDATRRSTIQLIENTLEEMLKELEVRKARREKYKNDPYAPAWPDPRRRTALKERAERIKAQLTIAEYVESMKPGTNLKRAGNNFKGHCPYIGHADHSPSFTIFPNEAAWCFGCQRGGDIFQVMGLVEGIESFREQVQFAEMYLGILTEEIVT